MIESLSEQNRDLSEENGQLKLDIKDFEASQELLEELDSSQRHVLKKMQMLYVYNLFF
jgi:hypothetical protein